MFSKDFGTDGNWVEGKEVGGFFSKRKTLVIMYSPGAI
jgi:hypothetical protein